MSEAWAGTALALAVALFGPIFVAVAGKRFAPAPDRLGPFLLGQAAMVAIVAAVLAVVFLWERNPASSIGLKSASFQSLAWGLALAAFLMYVFSPVAYWALRRFRLGSFEKGLAQLQGLPTWAVVLAVVIGGIAEEILYRGFAIERISTLTGSLWLGGAIPVLVFAVAHVPMWGWGPSLTTLVSGAILTLFYLWQRDLAACVVAHVITNLAGLVVGPRLASRHA